MEKHPLHIKSPELQASPEVGRAVERQQRKTGEKVPNEPGERIEAYLKRLEQLIFDPKQEQTRKDLGDIEHTERPRALSLLREKLLNEYVRPNKKQMAEAAARVEQRVARQMGARAEYNEERLEQRGEIAVGDLESSLDQWIKYLSDPNEPYPMWFRYYAFRNILNLGEYDKDRQEFPKRSKGTFKLFPDIDRGALAYIEERMTSAQDDAVLARIRESQKEFDTPEADIWTRQKAQAFVSLPFAKQYAEGIKSQGEITPELRAETRGQWIRYHQGDDPKELWKSLQGKGTAWCTRGYPTTKTQLEGGDFYVYYTLDKIGQPTIPRIAIRMEGQNKIAEPPRGVFDAQQNLEPNMIEILDEKLESFGSESDAYRKKSQDMKTLTNLERKQEANQPLTREDLIFLYEIDSPIEGFGYGRDPRIEELRVQRNPKEDILTVLDCTPDQIAHNPQEINSNIKAYLGSLEPGIFDSLQKYNLEHIYTFFPEGKIRKIDLAVGGETKEQLLQELAQKERSKEINISEPAKSMLENKDFITLKNPENLKLVRLKVKDLFGDNRSHTTDEIFQRAQELGLELCPPEVGPRLRLQYKDQPPSEWLLIAMKQITDFDGSPSVFCLGHVVGGLWLLDWAEPSNEWGPGREFVFRLRPPAL